MCIKEEVYGRVEEGGEERGRKVREMGVRGLQGGGGEVKFFVG